MNITPVIPDGFNGPIKQLTCRICKHLFYLPMADYERLREVSYCHECSLILQEELERNQAAPGSTVPRQTTRPASLPLKQVPATALRPPEPTFVSPWPVLHVPQPRSIERDKMTVAQLLEEAEMLGRLDRTREALVVYDDILHLDPTSAKACGKKGYALISLKLYHEAQATFDHAFQLDPSDSEAQSGRYFLSSLIFHKQEVDEDADTVKRQTEAKETLAKPCQSAEDYYEVGNALITLKRDAEAFQAFARSIELDPLDLDVYERVGSLHFYNGDHEKSLAIYNQALQIFVDCAKLHEKKAEALVRLKRYQEALDACNRAIQLDDMRASAYVRKGEILHQLRRFREALDAFDVAISLDPDAITARKQKAEMLAALWERSISGRSQWQKRDWKQRAKRSATRPSRRRSV